MADEDVDAHIPNEDAPPLDSGIADPEEGSGEDLMDENALARDYQAIPALDTYGREGIDEHASELSDLGVDERRRAEEEMRRRDRRRGAVAGRWVTGVERGCFLGGCGVDFFYFLLCFMSG
jgi:hypothetical protein